MELLCRTALLAVLLLSTGSSLTAAAEADAANYVYELGPGQAAGEDTGMSEFAVQEYPLVELPGCIVGDGATYALPEGLLETCNVELKNLEPGKPQLFMFDIGDNAEMTVNIVLRVVGGAASMALWHPGVPADQPPSQAAEEWTSSDASSESFINISPDTVISKPGTYVIMVQAVKNIPLGAWLRVNTPGRDNVLSAAEHTLMTQVAQSCCKHNITDSPFCSVIAPTALYRRHSWTRDLCHFGPTSCNSAGQVTRLVLPDLGLNCPKFPAMLAQLPKLKRLDLSGNTFDMVSADEVAQVLSASPSLEKLSLARTGMAGELSCEFLEIKSLTTLDLSNNFIEGPLRGCLLESLTELYVGGNLLVGTLAGWTSNSQISTLFVNNQQEGAGLIGSVPSSLTNMKRLRFLNLAGNSLSGPLPPLPRGIKLFNVSDNHVSGNLGPLPASIWIYDVRNNRMSGTIPPLSMYSSLQVFVASNNPLNGGIMALGPNLQQLELVRCGLSGSLPVLPSSLKRMDLSENGFDGDISNWDGSHLQMLRLANNQLQGWMPPSLASSQSLVLLDLHSNSLSGPLPTEWDAPRLQMIMLEGNALTGSIPPALANLPKLGVLRLARNLLSGGLSDFAAALKDPSKLAGWANEEQRDGFSDIFDLDLSGNQLSGPVPTQLGFLGVFNPQLTVVLPGPGGPMTHTPRRLDLSGNQLTGPWPTWVLEKVPDIISTCACTVSVVLPASETMHLECPETELRLTDYQWQVAAELGYTCWDGHTQQKVLDFISSPSNSLEAPGSATTASSSVVVDDGMTAETVLASWGIMGDEVGSKPKRGLARGAIAGVVIGSVVGSALLGLAAYYLVYEHLVKQQKATAFHRLKDDSLGGSTRGGGGGGSCPPRTGSSAGGSPAALLPPLPPTAPGSKSRSGGGSSSSSGHHGASSLVSSATAAAFAAAAKSSKSSSNKPVGSSGGGSSSSKPSSSSSKRPQDPRMIDVLEAEARAMGLVNEAL